MLERQGCWEEIIFLIVPDIISGKGEQWTANLIVHFSYISSSDRSSPLHISACSETQVHLCCTLTATEVFSTTHSVDKTIHSWSFSSTNWAKITICFSLTFLQKKVAERLQVYKDPGVYSPNMGQQVWAGIPSWASSRLSFDRLCSSVLIKKK